MATNAVKKKESRKYSNEFLDFFIDRMATAVASGELPLATRKEAISNEQR